MIALARLLWAVVRLLASSTEPFPPVDQDPDAVRDAACDIVRPDPTDCAPPTAPDLPAPGSGGGDGIGSSGAVVLYVVLALLVLALIVLAIRYVRAQAVDDSGEDAADDEDDPGEDLPDEAAGDLPDAAVADALEIEGAEWSGDRWRAAADDHHREGRPRLALRCRYRGLVTDLGVAGWLYELPGRTSGEHRRQVRLVAPDASGEFDAASDVFDAVWYGRAPVDDATWARFVALEQTVLGRVEQRR